MRVSADLGQLFVTFLTGGGAAAFITLVIRSIRTLRTGARASIRDVVKDLSAARNAADDRARAAEEDRNFWQATAGDYAYQLRQNGVTPQPLSPTPPSVRKAIQRRRSPRAVEES